MSAGGQELFVICKSCGSEVSPYITECPYCGNRLRKRAPKLDRHGRVTERRRAPAQQLTRLRRGEIPGIRADSHPYVTIVLVVVGLAGCLVWRTSAVSISQLAIQGHIGRDWWRLFTAPFTYDHIGYAFVALFAIALYGALFERRHGWVPVLALFMLAGAGGSAVAARASGQPVLGGASVALALLTAWAMRDLLLLRAGSEIDGDLLGTGVLAAILVLMPLAVTDASWASEGVGVAAGVVIGYPLARIHPG